MIFVTVGTHDQQFDRLLREVDRLVAQKTIGGKVIAQIGNSKYRPRNYEYFTFSSWRRILDLNKRSNVVITHGGAGSIMLAAHFNKPIVAVPRRKKYGEHADDHQIQLVRELEKEKRVIAVYEIENLSNAIKKAKLLKSKNRSQKKRRK